ncbi:hypothetical protein C8Q80DRAFT_1328903 [Daedaleopsis nitida]|nr:hypothetical protein C8Q80DRAFT_1328903 [Daedaleopsis nitida]
MRRILSSFLIPQRDEELWFEDGNLVLYAGEVEFRVYKGPFMAQSAFFKDMLSLPQPSDPPDGDGKSHSASAGTPSCAIVHLTDSPQDVRHFLRSFVEGGIKYEPTFDEVSAYIRLGHKYQCEQMVSRAVAYLRQYYVSDFNRWFAVTSLDPPAFRAVHRIGVVNLARLAGADDLLPVALMCCCILGPEIGDGFAREDGTHEALARADLARCFVGRARLLEAAFVAAHRTFRPPVADGCTQAERCTRALQQLLEGLVDHTGMMKDLRDLRIDSSKSAYIIETDEERALCRRCVAMVGKNGRGAEHHRDIFCRLPEMMGVVVKDWMKPRGGEQDQDDVTTT